MAPSLDPRRWLRPVGARLLVGAASVLVLGVLVQGWQARRWDRETLLEAEQVRARTVAATAAASIAGARHEALATSSAAPFTAWDRAPEDARALHAELARLAGYADLELPVVTLRLDDAAAATVRAAPDEAAPDALRVVATSAGAPTWLAARAYAPEMAPALLDGQATTRGLTVGPEGSVVTAWAPVRDAAGRVVGLVEVTAPVDHLLLRHIARSAGQTLLLGLIAAATLTLLGLAVTRYARGYAAVRGAARRLGQGDLTTALDPNGVPEFAGLATTLEDTRVALADRAAKVRTYAQQIAQQRDLALRGIDDAALARRQRYKDAREHLEAALRIGEGGPVPVLLLDLSYRTAAVKAEPTLDLAPGAPVRLRVKCRATGNHVTVPVTVHRRLPEGDKRVEYTLDLGVDAALVDFPGPVAEIMNGRDATRVEPAEGDRVGLHILIGDRRVKATITDISATGVGVRLARPATTIARWGTRLAVELILPDLPAPLPFTVEIKRIHDDGGKNPLVGMRWLEGLEGRFATRRQAILDYIATRTLPPVAEEAQAS